MLLTLLKNKWVYIIGIIIALSIFGYKMYSKYEDAKFGNDVLIQNAQAYKDSLEKTRDSIQTTAVFIKNLNENFDKSSAKYKREYYILKSEFDLFVAAVNDSGVGEVSQRDSIYTVKFGGKKSICTFDGKTDYNLNNPDSSKWSISLGFAPIFTKSETYYDDSLKLWMIRTLSMTGGVTLKGLSVLDENTLKEIRKVPGLLTDIRHIGFGGIIEKDRLYAGVMYKTADSWMFSLNYKISSKDQNTNENWYNQLSFGFYWFAF